MNERQIGAVLLLGGLLLGAYGYGAVSLSSVATTGYYYNCTVTEQSGLNITGCNAEALAEPAGAYDIIVTVNVAGCGSPSVIFTWPGGPVDTTAGTDQKSYASNPGGVSLSFTATSGAVTSAAGNIQVFTTSGTSTFTNDQASATLTCSSTTSTTSTTSTGPGGSGGAMNYDFLGVGAILSVMGVVLVAKKKV